MAFNNKVKMQAFEKAGGRCECTRSQCFHEGRCQNSCYDGMFVNQLRVASGEDPYFGGDFEFHHKVAESVGGEDILSNCEFLCKECHKRTRSYGRHSE